jgi:hypothetical protein
MKDLQSQRQRIAEHIEAACKAGEISPAAGDEMLKAIDWMDGEEELSPLARQQIEALQGPFRVQFRVT